MFQFPGFAPHLVRCRNRFRRVTPFGHPRVNGYLPLTAAFRSLSRPSSPPRAKASFMCPSLLSLGICPLPRLFAAYHVLRRLREPRHPSCALLSFPCALPGTPPRCPGGARRRLGAAVRRAASCKVSLALVSFEILSLSVRLSTLSFAFFKLPSCQCPRGAESCIL